MSALVVLSYVVIKICALTKMQYTCRQSRLCTTLLIVILITSVSARLIFVQ